jgi:hypothetical protein
VGGADLCGEGFAGYVGEGGEGCVGHGKGARVGGVGQTLVVGIGSFVKHRGEFGEYGRGYVESSKHVLSECDEVVYLSGGVSLVGHAWGTMARKHVEIRTAIGRHTEFLLSRNYIPISYMMFRREVSYRESSAKV